MPAQRHGAIVISSVLGSQITDDGKHALIKTAQPDGTEVTLAVPTEEMFNFMNLFAVVASQASEKAGQPKDVKTAFSTSWFELWFELGDDRASESVVLSLTFGAGGTLSFQMTRSMAEQMRETLNVMLGGTGPTTPATPRH